MPAVSAQMQKRGPQPWRGEEPGSWVDRAAYHLQGASSSVRAASLPTKSESVHVDKACCSLD
jgi:hypothetical protein